MIKAPSADEVLALVNATTAPDGTLDPAIQHLLTQLQEQTHTLDQAPDLRSNTGTSSVPECKKSVKSNRNYPNEVTPLSAAVTIGSTTLEKAIEWIMGPGNGIPSRAEKHFDWDVRASSFRKWWKNRDKIVKDSGSKKRVTGGGRKPYLEDSEEKLLVVVIQEQAKKDRVTRKWIAKTAQHMFQRSDTTFKASENWVSKFVQRNGLALKRSCVTYEPQQASLNLEHQQYQTSQTTTTVTTRGTNTTVVVQ
ncbi:unnamed protein product [Peronospora destructor]|uniref:HTH CENPB-type domain-containing protein n=1 Tax=Peronospora destructor TaxID=86335 RepID=A0AAV0U730_9STRA|nr:unnamed protein product [Peronospora destructor]